MAALVDAEDDESDTSSGRNKADTASVDSRFDRCSNHILAILARRIAPEVDTGNPRYVEVRASSGPRPRSFRLTR